MAVPKLSGIQAALAKKRELEQNALEIKPKLVSYADPNTVPERIRIIADDSSSMSGMAQEMKDGIIEFMRYCEFNKTSCAIHLMNGAMTTDEQKLEQLTTNLPALSVLIDKVRIGGSTPMFSAIKSAIEAGKATRYVLFSDGEPDSRIQFEEVTSQAKQAGTPIDTVYISYHQGTELDSPGLLMKQIAEATGGIFLHYRKGVSNFGKIFGALAPPQRLLLADPSYKAKVEGR